MAIGGVWDRDWVYASRVTRGGVLKYFGLLDLVNRHVLHLVSPRSGLRPVFNRTGPRINRTRPVLYLAVSQFNFGFGLGLQAVQDGPNHGLLPNLVNQLVLCLS